MDTEQNKVKFFAIDVETANPDMASICQVGIAVFDEAGLVDEWSSLVDPRDYFYACNVHVHGITERDVVGSPVFEEISGEMRQMLNGQICVHHTHFDKVSLTRTAEKHGVDPLTPIWLDSAKVARRAWSEFSRKGYGLASVCKKIGYQFNHHDALEDAKAAGHIMMAALQDSGLSLDEWLIRVGRPINPSSSRKKATSRGIYIVTQEGNP